MKAYKNNLIVQALLLLIFITLLVWVVFDQSILVIVFFLQFFLGIIQYFSGWFLKMTSPDDKLIRIYLTIASIDIISCFLLNITTIQHQIGHVFWFIIIGAIPWCLAILYWYISFKNVKYIFFKKSIFQ